MDAVEFFKTVKRLCKNQGCNKCPACKEGICMVMRMARLDENSVESIEETISKVEQWAKDNPINTRQSEFLKMFPNADLCRDVINILPCSVEKGMNKYCSNKRCEECRKNYWLTEVTNND